MKIYITVLLYGFFFLLSACGGSSKNPQTDIPLIIKSGTLSIAISDAPMSGVHHVRLVLDELVMTDSTGIVHHYPLEDVEFNLLDYQGMNSYMIVEGMELPAGEYHDAYFTVHQQDGNQGSWVENIHGRFDLLADGGKLPIGDISVTAEQHLTMTMEINLYSSMTNEVDVYQLHHNGIYSVDNSNMGHLIGEVNPQWIIDCETDNSHLSPDSGQFTHMAYLYPSNVTSIEHMADISDNRADQLTPPVSVSPMTQDANGNWNFEMGFLAPGDYQLGYSCLGHLDNPQQDDINYGYFMLFQEAGETLIETGMMGGTITTHQMGGGHGGGHGGGG